jgi:hypothetical protein
MAEKIVKDEAGFCSSGHRKTTFDRLIKSKQKLTEKTVDFCLYRTFARIREGGAITQLPVKSRLGFVTEAVFKGQSHERERVFFVAKVKLVTQKRRLFMIKDAQINKKDS